MGFDRAGSSARSVQLRELASVCGFSEVQCSAPTCRRLDGPCLHRAHEVRLPKAYMSPDLHERNAPRFDEASHHALIHGEDFRGLLDGQEHLYR